MQYVGAQPDRASPKGAVRRGGGRAVPFWGHSCSEDTDVPACVTAWCLRLDGIPQQTLSPAPGEGGDPVGHSGDFVLFGEEDGALSRPCLEEGRRRTYTEGDASVRGGGAPPGLSRFRGNKLTSVSTCVVCSVGTAASAWGVGHFACSVYLIRSSLTPCGAEGSS